MTVRQSRLMLIAVLLLVFTACKSHPSRSDRVEMFRHPGLLWLSWNSSERENFVYGYIHGYAHGMSEACLAADRLFETDKPHIIGHDNVPSTLPSARCRVSVGQYPTIRFSPSAGPDFTPYTVVITEFYTNHPDKRHVLFTQLMEYFAGARIPTADELAHKFE